MEIKRVPISEVEVWEKNPRNIKTKDFERLKRQIQELGVYKPLICYRENGKYVTLGGNMRLRALGSLGVEEVEVSVVEAKDEATKIKYALSDNDRAGEYDEQKLAELTFPHIEEINLEDYKLDVGRPISLKDLIEDYAPDVDGEDEIPEIDDSPAITKMGDLFTLSKHRLLCGDATKEGDVKRLMGGEKADMVFTDPPYNVDYDYASKYTDGRKIKHKAIFSDNLKKEQYCEFLEKTFLNLFIHTKDDAPFYIWHSDKFRREYLNILEKIGWYISQPIIWVKNNHVLALSQDYHRKFEAVLYGWKKGKKHYYNSRCAYMNDVWEIEKDKNYEHPTQKPVKLILNAIKKSAKSNALILDLFLGSGSTLIGCEKVRKNCYGTEIDPKYCDVIITRYSNFAGISEEEIRATRQ